MIDWEKLDWSALDRLREGFLSGSAAEGPYWTSLKDLEHYNLTFGERIGWKWDAVLRELRLRGWAPTARAFPFAGEQSSAFASVSDSGAGALPLRILDWGCGSGIAGRRVIDAFGANRFGELWVWDHSPLAREFAQGAARERYPGLRVSEWRRGEVPDLLVLSHIVNELPPATLEEVIALAKQAGAVLWVEPGTHAVSHQLTQVREELREVARIIAPCTHQAACGLLTAANAQHWCHHFADPPPALYSDSNWVKFGQRAGIDLRSLPYSFLVTDRTAAAAPNDTPGAPQPARIIGDARHFKGYAKLLSCDASGVNELMLQKRDDPVLFKALKRPAGVPIYRWTRERDRISKAEPLYREPAPPAATTGAEPAP